MSDQVVNTNVNGQTTLKNNEKWFQDMILFDTLSFPGNTVSIRFEEINISIS